VDRATQKVDHEGEDGGATCSIAKEECHEGVVDIAVALRGEVAGQVNDNVTSRRERH
jgi:coenzyme F420-reducing hydrogenase beta subunit